MEGEVWDTEDARADAERSVTYFGGMLERGISMASFPFEAMFLSLAHSEEDVERTLDVHLEVLQAMVMHRAQGERYWKAFAVIFLIVHVVFLSAPPVIWVMAAGDGAMFVALGATL